MLHVGEELIALTVVAAMEQCHIVIIYARNTAC